MARASLPNDPASPDRQSIPAPSRREGIDRRQVLGRGLALPLAGTGFAGACAHAAPAGRDFSGDPDRLLPKSPEESLIGFLRLFAGIETTSVFTNEGIIYGKAPGDLMRPLFGFLAVLEIRTKAAGDGVYEAEQKEAMVCLNLASRTLMKDWRNPYTDETLIPVGYVSPVNRYFFTATGSYMRTRPEGGGEPTPRDWRSSATDVWFTESRYNSFPASISAEEFPRAFASPVRNSVDILSYRAKAADFADASLRSVPSTLTMVSDTPWPLWMMMGKREGGAVWHGFGQKYADFAGLPDVNRRLIDEAYPGFLDDPWAYPHAEWGTAAQLRRLRDEGRLIP